MPWAPPWEPYEDKQLLEVVRAGRAAGSAPERAGLQRTPAACVTRMTFLRRAGHEVAARHGAGAWARDEADRLIEMYREDWTYKQIGDEFGRTIGAVDDEVRRLRRAGIDLPERKPRWTPERRRRLAKLKRQGVTLRGLEEEFGLTRGAIPYQLRTLRRDGLPPPQDPLSSAPLPRPRVTYTCGTSRLA